MKLRLLLPLLSLPLLAATARDARAQAAPRSDLPPGDFMLMGADGDATSMHAALTILTADGEDENIYRFDLGGQYMSPSGMGGYASIAGSSLDGNSHLGSLELGGVWKRKASTSDLTVRVGVLLPTSSIDDEGSDDGDVMGALGHISSTLLSRPGDFVTSVPDATVIRASVSPSFRRETFVARLDAGLDFVVAADGEEPEQPYVHVDFGAGYDDGKMGFLFEMSTFAYLEDADELAHVGAITGQLHSGNTTPYVTVSMPYGDFVDLGDVTNFTLGVRGRL